MAEISLKNRFICHVDEEDVALVSGYTWRAAKSGNVFYAVTNKVIDGKRVLILMHRLILGAQAGQICDHADGDGLNNRRSNIRFCTYSENMCNKRVSHASKTGVKNVYSVVNRHGNQKYDVEAKNNGKRVRRRFSVLEDAIAFSTLVREDLHGEFSTSAERAARFVHAADCSAHP